ncbi:DNA-binding protein [Scytonema sp. NUACC26]|uniref:helix-turn-helix domain-containing transcriptional regulator n=1 Tax=Scytonema sp. NUACC26 TaxID=3140176 RepID=UPI0034DBF6D0
MRLKDLSETFRDELRDPEFAAGYLHAAMEENDLNTFLIALRDVIQANIDRIDLQVAEVEKRKP